MNSISITVTLVAVSLVVSSNGFSVGELVTCNLCHPFAGDTAPEECNTDPEYGVECPLCYQLSGSDDFFREICVPVSNYMTIMNTVIQPELELCWMKNQGNCVLRLVGPVSSSSPTISPEPATKDPDCANSTDEDDASIVENEIDESGVDEGYDVEDSVVQGNGIEDNDIHGDDAEDDSIADDAVENDSVADDTVEDDSIVEDDTVEDDTVDDDEEDVNVVTETLDIDDEDEDSTDLFEEIFLLFVNEETSMASTLEQ